MLNEKIYKDIETVLLEAEEELTTGELIERLYAKWNGISDVTNIPRPDVLLLTLANVTRTALEGLEVRDENGAFNDYCCATVKTPGGDLGVSFGSYARDGKEAYGQALWIHSKWM